MKFFDAIARLLIPLLSTVTLRSHDAWETFPQENSTANLWGIAYASDRGTLVAVGEQGTILSFSYATESWDLAVSGSSLWLVGVGYGYGRFVAVGEQGTILTSDDNGITWTPRVSGTTKRLNAVAYGNGIWLAIGEQGTALTSPDGITWTTRPAQGSGFLRGLDFGQGRFVFGGAGGALFTTTDGAAFTPVPISTTADIEGVAISANHFWVVGSQGLRATATTLGSWVFATNAMPGQTFRGVTTRNRDEASAVGNYKGDVWLETNWGEYIFREPALFATAVTEGQNEIVAVGFGGAVVRSLAQTARFPLQPRFWSKNAQYGRDYRIGLRTSFAATGYQWTRAGQDLPGETGSELILRHVTAVDPAIYGVRLFTAFGPQTITFPINYGLVPAGRPEIIDRNFTSALPLPPTFVEPQPDGKLLVAGGFSVAPAGGATYGLARLNPDGTLDQSFRAGDGISVGTAIAAMHVLSDGKIYVSGSFGSIGGHPRAGIARLFPNGSIDSGFNPDNELGYPVKTLVGTDGRLFLQDKTNTIVHLNLDGSRDPRFVPSIVHRLVGVDSQNRVLALKNASNPGDKSLVRLLANGALDPTYMEAAIVSGPQVDEFFRSVVNDAGIYAITYQKFSALSPVRYLLTRFKPNGGRDPEYRAPPAFSNNSLYEGSLTFSYRADGGVWVVFQPSRYSTALDTPPRFFGPSGDFDPNIYATLPDRSRYSIRAIAADGSLIASEDQGDRFGETLIRVVPITGRSGRLTNLSVRAFVETHAAPLIVGFVTAGTGTARALVRAIGPGLAPFGVNDAMSDPRLTLVRDGLAIESNDQWPAALAPRFAAVGAFPLPINSRDAALETSVFAGNHTVLVAPVEGSTPGTALAEVYEFADADGAPRRFVNTSARGPVTQDRPLIVGFTLSGEVPRTVLIRAAGPRLAVFGVGDAHADPNLTLYRGGGPMLWENNDWSANPNERNAISLAGAYSGAFPFVTGELDSAMVVTLAPGSYTAVVTGVTNTTGTALVEVYETP